jgi:hypothetical protein
MPRTNRPKGLLYLFLGLTGIGAIAAVIARGGQVDTFVTVMAPVLVLWGLSLMRRS